MFKDLKEYQEITQIYHDSVNISEEQREINRLFLEEGFTAEEIQYLDENFDEIWENEISILIKEEVSDLTEEQINELVLPAALPLLKKGFAFDLETTSLDPQDAEIVAISLSASEGISFVIDCRMQNASNDLFNMSS